MIESLQDTESRILAAAEREFMEKGLAGAKTTSIARSAGVTHAMLHYYFRSKNNLFERVVAEKFRSLADIMFDMIDDERLPLRQRIVNGIERHYDFIAANASLPRFIFNETHLHPEFLETVSSQLAKIKEEVVAKLQKTIDENAASGSCVRVDAQQLLLDIISLNIFPFIAAPVINAVFVDDAESWEELMRRRKDENVATILKKLGIKY